MEGKMLASEYEEDVQRDRREDEALAMSMEKTLKAAQMQAERLRGEAARQERIAAACKAALSELQPNKAVNGSYDVP